VTSVIKPRRVERKLWHLWWKLQIQGKFGLKLCRVILKAVLREWGVDFDLSRLAYGEKVAECCEKLMNFRVT
jgi:hypothetical protein